MRFTLSHHRRLRRHGASAHRRDRSRGAVIVEFALIFPLFATLLFGMISAGLVMNRRATVTQAAREGARYAATVPLEQCTPASLCGGKTWAQLVLNQTKGRVGNSATTANICIAMVKGPGTAPVPVSATHTTKSPAAACYIDNNADNTERVQVMITFTDRIQAIFLKVPINVTTRATTKAEV